MQAIKKSGTRLLQTEAFKDQSIEQDFRNTYTEDFILDFYTTAHPYAPLAASKLAGNIGLNHTNPELYFVPKQRALGLFNESFGDELYLVEQHPTNESKNLAIFGKPLRIVSTDTVLTNIRANYRFKVDQEEYIKARLFDMLIGDWDRHADQYSWGEYKVGNDIIYRPIPLDRDQAFSKFDGALLFVALKFPPIRHMKTFDEDFKSARWFNRLAYHLDLALLPDASEADWTKQADVIVKSLTDAEINRAFNSIPSEVRDETVQKLKEQLKSRKGKLSYYASQYHQVLQQTVLIVGTQGDDRFEITRENTSTVVKIFSSDNNITPYFETTYKKPQTKELWIYGLGGADQFNITGNGSRKMLVRLMGGADSDTYAASEGKKIKIYDFKSQPNDVTESGSAKLRLSDKYDLNAYDYQKPIYNIFGSLPSIGYNPDDGVKVGVAINYTVNQFKRAPFSQKHTFNANYFFATNGYELLYKGTFPQVVGDWDFVVDLQYTS
ncbi:MAG TPA: metallophosphoesterase, partial [Flavobacterium sp.]|nr:metallophosphoesterase [Flavobacterium sp.]